MGGIFNGVEQIGDVQKSKCCDERCKRNWNNFCREKWKGRLWIHQNQSLNIICNLFFFWNFFLFEPNPSEYSTMIIAQSRAVVKERRLLLLKHISGRRALSSYKSDIVDSL